ncbi:hypothetical protein ACT3R7_03335 [Halomonas sp. AOP43-A1-21]
MKVYQIDYDLRNERNYAALYDRIRTYQHCRPLESTWIISTQQTAVQVRDNLKGAIDADDGLLVTSLTGEAAGFNVKQAQDLRNLLRSKS